MLFAILRQRQRLALERAGSDAEKSIEFVLLPDVQYFSTHKKIHKGGWQRLLSSSPLKLCSPRGMAVVPDEDGKSLLTSSQFTHLTWHMSHAASAMRSQPYCLHSIRLDCDA